MAQSDRPAREPASIAANGNNSQSLWRKLFARDKASPGMPESPTKEQDSQSDDEHKPGLIRRVSRKVVPNLPRAQTFKRQQSEIRNKLEPVHPTPAERRAVSADRRLQTSQNGSQTQSNPRSSAPDFINHSFSAVPFAPSVPSIPSLPVSSLHGKMINSTSGLDLPSSTPDFQDGRPNGDDHKHIPDAASIGDGHSMTTSQYDALIHDELECRWILNLSMHFRDKSKREKFFVTYRERPTLWRRVTISVDYRNAPENSLELELSQIKFQRDKIAKIYDAIRESLDDIQFYPTVTNLKLQTTDGRLHVHVVEDVNEIIHYPSVHSIQHLRCNRIKERDIDFDSHISGFVYKVRVNDEVLIKKEIPGPDTVDEFLYEINALNRLKYSNHVIKFYGVIVDDNGEHVKGLLISHAGQGALIDIIYDQVHPLPWSTRERWARQIVSGLSEIHEAGFVQGDFTLSNIVIDDDDDAKIIDINRRGCPVGWEPPEATALIESNQRISMYIGVKSDLYQLGMVLWALAMKEDEPESHGRPLRIGPEVADIPSWYRRVVDICLSEDPRGRMAALQLLSFFPDPEPQSEVYGLYGRPSISVDDGVTRQEYFVDADIPTNGYPHVRTVHPAGDWAYVGWGHSYMNSPNGMSEEPFFYPTRGRSPPSPLPSNPGEEYSSKYGYRTAAWVSTHGSERTVPSEIDAQTEERAEESKDSVTPRSSKASMADAGQTDGVVQREESELAENAYDERGGGAVADVRDMNDTPASSQKPVCPQPPEGLPAQADGSSAPLQLYAQENFGESDDRKTAPLDAAAFVHHLQAETTAGPPETGYTAPELPANSRKNNSTGDNGLRGPVLDGVDKSASAVDATNIGQSLDGVGIAPEMVALPYSGPPSEETEDVVQAVSLLSTMEEERYKEAVTPANEPLAGQSYSDTEPLTSSNALRDVPDVLKGVGSTHDAADEYRRRSITDQDLALLIDAEAPTDMRNDSNDTTVMKSTER